MKPKAVLPVVLGAVAVVIVAVIAVRHFTAQGQSQKTLRLYGNIDIRTVNLAFDDSGRISHIAVEEGSAVRRGALLAEIDSSRYAAAEQQARGTLAVARQQLALLEAGNRPQQIAEARAAVTSATATLHNAQLTYDRQRALAAAHLLPQQSADNALQALKNARAVLQAAQQALSLQLVGARKEQIAGARAEVQAASGALALAQRQLADTRLYAPDDGFIQTRVLEVGDMVSPQAPVLTLALDNPVWARVYLPEPELGRIAPGMRAEILSDSFPGVRFPGWIGFISPTAEFTPKSVQTTELRTELVYRVRVYACNAQGKLRLGMPVTVQVPLQDNVPQTIPAHVCGH